MTEKDIYAAYKRGGLKKLVAVAQEALNTGDNILRGAACEIVLECVTKEYLKKTEKVGAFYRSVVLKDLQRHDSERFVEVDGVLVTPYFILAAECKSYRGNLIIEGNGTICGKNREPMDVYGQSVAHKSALDEYGKQLSLAGLGDPHPPIFYYGFIYSNAAVEDRRSGNSKKAFTFATLGTIVKMYDAMFVKYKTTKFDYERACTIFGKCSRSKKLHRSHADYVGY